MLKRTGSLVMAALSVAALVGGGSATAASKKSLMVKGCREQRASALVPREQAQQLVPEGFRAFGGPGGDVEQEELVVVFFSTRSCGPAEAPTLEMFLSYVQVEPPKGLKGAGGNYFLIDGGAEGKLARKVLKHTCTTDVFKKADIESTQTIQRLPEGNVSTGTANVSSGAVQADMEIRAGGPDTAGPGGARWFTSGGAKPRFFDTATHTSFFSIGASAVSFAEPYRGLQPVQAYAGVIAEYDGLYFRPKGC